MLQKQIRLVLSYVLWGITLGPAFALAAGSAAPVGMPGAAAVPGSAPGPAAGAVGPGTGAVMYGGSVANPGTAGTGLSNLNSGFQPGQVPTFTSPQYNTSLTPNVNAMYGGVSPFMGMCSQMLAGLFGNSSGNIAADQDFARKLEDAVLNGSPEYAPNANKRAWSDLGKRFNPKLSGSCQQKFITTDGKLGPLGKYLMANIQEHRDAFIDSTPNDMLKYCPKYSTFEKTADPKAGEDAKARFYVYLIMSMVQPESSCNPTSVGRGPNGNAVGLLQLEPKACARVGMSFSESDLMDPLKNLRCGVAVLAKELTARHTITVGTSRGPNGTYWATLRDDPGRANSASGMVRADAVAAATTQKLLKGFEECQNGILDANNSGASTQSVGTAAASKTRTPAAAPSKTTPSRSSPATPGGG